MVTSAFVVPYAAYLSLDLRQLLRTGSYENRAARALKLGSIVAIAALTWIPGDGHGEVTLLRLAFVLTVCGDALFSLLRRFVAGVAVFALVQLVYVARHLSAFHGTPGQLGVLAALLAIGGVLFTSIRPGLRAKGLAGPVGAYIALSAVSLGVAAGQFWSAEVPFEVALRSTVGIALLAACDASIGARTVLEGPRRQWLGFATWALYLPAMLALASSGATVLS